MHMEIISSSTSIYVEFPYASCFKDIIQFKGKIAVVGLPCHLAALRKFEEKNPEIINKVAIKISLFCSGNPTNELIERIMVKNKIPVENINRIIFRKGHWRGTTQIILNDGTKKEI